MTGYCVLAQPRCGVVSPSGVILTTWLANLFVHYTLFVWACLADKPWLKVLLTDLV